MTDKAKQKKKRQDKKKTRPHKQYSKNVYMDGTDNLEDTKG